MESKPQSCPACGNDQYAAVAEVSPEPDVFFDGKSLCYECAFCGLQMLWPRLSAEQLKQYYREPVARTKCQASDFNSLSAQKSLKIKLNRALHLEKHLGIIPGFALDVGCGRGMEIGALESRGWKCTGLEPNPKFAAEARERWNAEIIECTFDEADNKLSGRKFDLVIIGSLLHMVQDPVKLLKECKNRLSPTGIMLVEIPNERYNYNALFINHVAWGKAENEPRTYCRAVKLFYFTISSAEKMLNTAGLVPVAQWTYSHNGAGKFFTDYFARLQAKSGRITEMLCSIILSAGRITGLWSFLSYCYDRAGLGEALVFICRAADKQDKAGNPL